MERPLSEFKGQETIDNTWRLTHVIWYSISMYANAYYPSNETGIHFLNDRDAKGNPRFALIQHCWRNFNKAGNFIRAGLRKGWDADKILDVMTYLHQREPGL